VDNQPTILIAIADDVVRKAIGITLARALPAFRVYTDGFGTGDGAVVVSTPRDCGLTRCNEFAQLGRSVVILAPVPRTTEATAYLQAGAAAYLPMDPNTGALVRAVAASAARPSVSGDGHAGDAHEAPR
jgi:DNA-binding NarL/FixJ family response regulator